MQKKFQSFGSYLEFSRKQFLLLNQNFGENIQKYQKISLVYGNESADLDSCLGSSTLAFYYNILKNQDNQLEKQQKLFIPVINCCQRDIETKFEFISLLEKYQISLESLVYKDSFDLNCFINQIKKQQFDGFELILYDHNKPDTNLMKFKNYVKQIIDHHADETDQIYEKGQIEKQVIKTIGSATSILSLIMQECEIGKQLLKENLIITEGIHNCILLDTYNFNEKLKNSRWNQEDLQAIEIIEQYLKNEKQQIDRNQIMEKLSELKFSIEMNRKLGVSKLLIKDYKQFSYQNMSFGYSVIAIEPKFFLELQDLEQKIQDFIQENSLKALFLLFVYPQQQNKTVFERQFIFICEDQVVKQKVQNTLVSNMKYEFRNYDEKFEKFQKHYFALYDVTSTFSRKLLEPLVRDIKF